mmetsp:Transcript_15761/g.52746  ORF Transcript_15761/g.52746 Transcript_15761/m.52746 type:complete len:399 (-) Transcript_15761:88-1284(-)
MSSPVHRQTYEYGAVLLVVTFLASWPSSLGYTLSPSTSPAALHAQNSLSSFRPSYRRSSHNILTATRNSPINLSMVASRTDSQVLSNVAEQQQTDSKSYWRIKRVKGLHLAAEKGYVDLTYIDIPSKSPEAACPVLILHGLLGSSRNFLGWANTLSERLAKPRRIIIPDLRNHGESPHTRSMGYVSMAQDVISLLDRMGIERCCVIGHSMGGKVAATLALLHPTRVESVAILDIAPADYSKALGKGSETWRDIAVTINSLYGLPLEEVKDKRHADELLAASIQDPLLRAFALTNLVKEDQAWKWRIGIQNIKRNMGIIGGFDLGQGLQQPASVLGLSFPGDAFFVQGGKSPFIRSRHLEEIMRLFPNFTLQTIRNAGHWVHSEDPETTLQNVQNFLDR